MQYLKSILYNQIKDNKLQGTEKCFVDSDMNISICYKLTYTSPMLIPNCRGWNHLLPAQAPGP